MQKNLTYTLLIAALWFAPRCLEAAQGHPERGGDGAKITLAQGWLIQSSAKITEKGAVISTSNFQPRNWYAATIPSTVVAALVENNVYADPFFGMDLRSYPGMSYGIGQNFSNSAMAQASPFRPA